MNKDIKDYLHLYLGCEVKTNDVRLDETKTHHGRTGTFIGFVDYHRLDCRLKFRGGEPEGRCSVFMLKPILRPLSDISYDEREIIGGIIDPDKEYEDDYNGYNYTHEQVGQWFINHLIKNETESDIMYRPKRFIKAINTLRRMGFDCDGPIEAGLAIDKTKLNNHE